LSLSLRRAERGRGIPEGGKLAEEGVELAEGRVGTRGVATGIAARFLRGLLCEDVFRGGLPLPLPPSPEPGPPERRSSEL
jgi:hypothetical protein